MAMSRDICSCLLRRTARSFAPFAPAAAVFDSATIEPEAKTLEAGGSNSLGKDQPQYAGDRGYRNSVQTCCDAADGGGCVDDQVDAASAAFRSSCVASHGTPDKSGRIDLLKERYVSRDGVHGIAAAANVRYTDVPIRHQSQRPPTCTAHHCNIAPRVPPHGCPPARKCPVRCRPRQRFPAAWPPISRSFAFSSIGSGAPILRHGAQSNPREPASIFR
jgi:hypothetical protein